VGNTPSHRFHDHPIDDVALRFELLFNNPFVHSSVMIRKSSLDEIGLYTTDPERQPPEDYELWSRLARRFHVANLAERLTIYREVPNSISRAGNNPFLKKMVLISSENLAMAAGAEKPGQVHIDIAALIHGSEAQVSSAPDLRAMEAVIRVAVRVIAGEPPSEDMLRRILAKERRLKRNLLLRKPYYRGIMNAGRAVRNGLRRLRYASQ
jgi:hypothetical protein